MKQQMRRPLPGFEPIHLRPIRHPSQPKKHKCKVAPVKSVNAFVLFRALQATAKDHTETLPSLPTHPAKALHPSLKLGSREEAHTPSSKKFLILLRKSMTFKTLHPTPLQSLSMTHTRLSRPGTVTRSRDWEFQHNSEVSDDSVFVSQWR